MLRGMVAGAVVLLCTWSPSFSSAQTSPTFPTGGGSARRIITGTDRPHQTRSSTADARSLYYAHMARFWFSMPAQSAGAILRVRLLGTPLH
jgi:hypothetical protein